MNSEGTMNVWRGHFRSLMWLGVVAILLTVLPGFYSDLFASDNSTPCTASTRQAAKQTPESARPGRTKAAEGEYRVLSQSGIGSFVPPFTISENRGFFGAWSSITRGASHDPKAMTPVELLTFEEPSNAEPIFTTTLGGRLKYFGQEKLLLAGREWLAGKFELKVATHAPFLLWTSSQGLLLAFPHEKDSKRLPDNEGMVSVGVRKLQEF